MITDDRMTDEMPTTAPEPTAPPRPVWPIVAGMIGVAILLVGLLALVVRTDRATGDAAAPTVPPPVPAAEVDPADAEGESDAGVDPDVAQAPPAPELTASAADRQRAIAATEAPAADDVPVAAAVEAATFRPGASRFVAQPPARVLDTRDLGDRPRPDTNLTLAPTPLPSGSSLMLSVSILDSERDGAVLFDGGAGAVEAIRIPGAGGTTTNLTVVPVDGGDVSVRSSAGGHLVIDVVGTFRPVTGPVAAGRFVATDPVRIGNLVTREEGREIELPVAGTTWTESNIYDEAGSQATSAAYDFSDASAVLAVITADVADEGGVVRAGPEHGEYEQMLMWGGASGDDTDRQGLVVLRRTGDTFAALRYEGGAELNVHVVGYFTDRSAEADTAGLFVPASTEPVYEGPIAARGWAPLSGLDSDASAALVSLNPIRGVPGRLGAAVVRVEDGEASVWSRDDVEVAVALLGEFS